MTQDILMGDDLEIEMKQKEEQIINKKRTIMLAKIKKRTPGLKGKETNRNLLVHLYSDSEVKRTVYRKEGAKLSDRYFPRLKNYGDLECLFHGFNGELKLRKENIEFIKEVEG
eukprot:GHVR01150129.1.p1 GENE.GHVR01150129.1~~GHVR01150129.1.p1  ORF type:complete len:113 (+),score=14.70 GHVR01150129.1:835-1173(+)